MKLTARWVRWSVSARGTSAGDLHRPDCRRAGGRQQRAGETCRADAAYRRRGVAILLETGVPPGVIQLLPGRGETVGAALTSDERVRGVMFTGSTEVATLLQRNIASRLDPRGRPTPLIAETGGMNAMIVDSSALTEQVVIDVLASAFDSAGQRCSALRVLCLQEEVADHTLTMLRGAMSECRMGNPGRLTTDIGPVIDAEAKENIERHIQAMRVKGRTVYRAVRENSEDAREWRHGTFVPPTLIELDSFDELKKRSSARYCTWCATTVTSWTNWSSRLTPLATA